MSLVLTDKEIEGVLGDLEFYYKIAQNLIDVV